MAVINTWVEAPKKYNLTNEIRKFCIDNNVTIHSLYSDPVNRDFLDKVLAINREVVYFHIEGSEYALTYLKNWLESMAKKIN